MYEIKKKDSLSVLEQQALNRNKNKSKYRDLDNIVIQLEVGDVYVDDFDAGRTIDELETLVPKLRQHFSQKSEAKYNTQCGVVDGRATLLIERIG